ncbi:hypothetical protein HDU97_005694 [Phlyctochytrium planicorne]|nr:hypothetical protein HDU97_005694 [Phlyctochytrium planicorne]
MQNPYSAPGDVVYSCNLERKVALTFDDGPSIYTHELLDVLKNENVTATFFVVASKIAEYKDVFIRMVSEGHTIGSHTWSHQNLSSLMDRGNVKYNPERAREEIVKAENIIKDITGERPYLFRPPYGAINKEVRDILAERLYTIVLWNVGCIDWYFHDGDIELKAHLSGMPDSGLNAFDSKKLTISKFNTTLDSGAEIFRWLAKSSS